MNMGAVVSVIVPTYKRPALLAQALRSLVVQTYRDFEVLVCDNAADPETRAVVEGLHDTRFIYLPRERNLGILGNVVEGFRAGTSELVMELDDDDFLAPSCLEKLIEPFEQRPGLVLSFSDMEIVDQNGAVASAEVRASQIQAGRNLTEGFYSDFTTEAVKGYVFTNAALLRRSAVDWTLIPVEATTSYDRYLALQAAKVPGGAYYVNERLVNYRVHPDMDTETAFWKQLDGALFVLERAWADAGPKERRLLEDELVNLRFEKARRHARCREMAQVAGTLTPLLFTRAGLAYANRVLTKKVRTARTRVFR